VAMAQRRMAARVAACLLLTIGAVLVAPAGPAAATVGSTAAPWTPQILTPRAIVRQLVKCGHLMYAVGRFRKVGQGGHRYLRRNAFSFDERTGAVTSWNPRVDGIVDSIALGPRCRTAYLGGKFDSVGGREVHNLAAVGAHTGALRRHFGHTTDGEVETLALVQGGQHLLVGGAFGVINGTSRARFASVDPATGKVDGYVRLGVAGLLPGSSGRRMVYNQQVSPSGDRLLIEGNFTRVGGQRRWQMAELNLGPTSVTLNSWRNYRLNHTQCADDMVFYARSAAFSPDEQTIYLATTGFDGSSPFCDAVTAFSNTSPASIEWINKTGGDSLYSVAASATDVYIGGHERWADNPQGLNSCGPGCVPRPGIGDIDPSTGRATSWNPTRDRGRGADDLLITRAGLWVASDTYFDSVLCAGKYHPGICFFPGTA